MKTLTYVSSARSELSEDDLINLLNKCRDNNAKFGVTGVLLYKSGNFMQSIEGPGDAIDRLYKNICADMLHHNVIKIIEYPVTERAFADWTMAFANLTRNGAKDLPAFIDFSRWPVNPAEFEGLGSAAKRLLLHFRNS